MRLLYVELSPSMKRKDIFERIESIHHSLSYQDVEIGILTARDSLYFLKKLREGSVENRISQSIAELLRFFFKDCRRVYILREDGEVSKPFEQCFVSGVYHDPPSDFEYILESLHYSPVRLSLGSIPYLASSLIPILNRLSDLEHIFNTFMK